MLRTNNAKGMTEVASHLSVSTVYKTTRQQTFFLHFLGFLKQGSLDQLTRGKSCEKPLVFSALFQRLYFGREAEYNGGLGVTGFD